MKSISFWLATINSPLRGARKRGFYGRATARAWIENFRREDPANTEWSLEMVVLTD